MEVASTSQVSVFECISSEGSTANPLKKRSFRRPMEQPVVDEDPRFVFDCLQNLVMLGTFRKVADFFRHCEDGAKTLYYHI